MQLIDTHCHIDADEFNRDRPQVLLRANNNGVEKIIVPAITQQRFNHLLEICGASSMLYPALGLHPVYLDQHQPNDLASLNKTLNDSKVVAVGEIGLDYYLKHLDKKIQIELFEAQLFLASTHQLPVILHCRKAHDDLIRCLTKVELPGGIVHAFNGSIQQAFKLIEMGYKLGFGGMLTFERSTKLRNLAAKLPLSSLVIETDSPDLTVAQHAGERNSPEHLPYVLKTLVQIRTESIQEISQQLYKNSIEVFQSTLDR